MQGRGGVIERKDTKSMVEVKSHSGKQLFSTNDPKGDIEMKDARK